MRPIFVSIFFLFVCSVFVLSTNAQDGVKSFPMQVTATEVANGVLGGMSLSSDEYIQWTSSEGTTYHCKPDSVFRFIRGGKKIMLIVLVSKIKEAWGGFEECHACKPTIGMIELVFDDAARIWNIKRTNKKMGEHGAWGEPPTYSLVFLWDDQYCLLIDENYVMQGVSTNTHTLYLNGIEALAYTRAEDNGGEEEEGSRKYYSFESLPTVIANEKKLLLSVFGKIPKNGKVVPVNAKKIYVLSGAGRFQQTTE